MQLVRFGKCVINFANVCDIYFGGETATIYFNVARSYWDDGEGRSEQESIQLTGADVIALEMWLTDNSDNARAPMEEV